MNNLNTLIQNYTSSKGFIELLQVENLSPKPDLVIPLPFTLRRLELLAFLDQMISQKVKHRLFLEAHALNNIMQFYQEQNLTIGLLEDDITVFRDDFLKSHAVTILSVLKQFERQVIWDNLNSIFLPYDESNLETNLLLVSFAKEDEIFWSWNKWQLHNSDLVEVYKKGEYFSLIKSDFSHVPTEIKLCIEKQLIEKNGIFIIIEALSHHEAEIQSFIQTLMHHFYHLLIKVAIKEVAVIEPTVYLLFPNNLKS